MEPVFANQLPYFFPKLVIQKLCSIYFSCDSMTSLRIG